MEELDNDNVICYFHDWQHRATDAPRSQTETVQYRYGLTSCTNSWALTEFRANGTHIHHKYASSLRDLCPYFLSLAHLDIIDTLRLIEKSLSAVTKIDSNIQIKTLPRRINVAIDLADQIDHCFQINYAIHDDIRERIFSKQMGV